MLRQLRSQVDRRRQRLLSVVALLMRRLSLSMLHRRHLTSSPFLQAPQRRQRSRFLSLQLLRQFCLAIVAWVLQMRWRCPGAIPGASARLVLTPDSSQWQPMAARAAVRDASGERERALQARVPQAQATQ